MACVECRGIEPYEDEDMGPELCACVEMDGITDEGRVLITMGAMMTMRRGDWEVERDTRGVSKLQSKEVPLEELQEQGVPMVIVGTDVVNLYPSLDIDRVVEDVEQAMLDTKIRWTEIDYLEAARYVALNWSEDECRRSGLGRILPRRRKSGGRRPGLRGAGPQGGVRGDQEQWIFPHVRLRPAERRLLVATVVRLLWFCWD